MVAYAWNTFCGKENYTAGGWEQFLALMTEGKSHRRMIRVSHHPFQGPLSPSLP